MAWGSVSSSNMRLEEGIKLEFKDVLFRPKRSTLSSRAEVSLDITYRFRNSKKTWTGVPLVAANMDTTGTFEMAVAFAKRKCLVCMHKHYTVDEWKVRKTRNQSRTRGAYQLTLLHFIESTSAGFRS